ncbi:dihydrolipoyl dehydrogenase [Peribacillus glennii]|uniref:Dihydrolipoyl dehydrogenase n=1 Tax=Peribacillus glennii TaxID=2303991 RepID=A0A372LJ70_9BACI|nr:dihydrolipoyl dehydrogenase [Peribacillus glennii]RFU66014.1 dihydrolipoyl dehydrogenase [Peribacillus glennii]
MKNYEVVVIGGGPGGYVAAEEAAKLCGSVALIENKYLGGTCLNSGCIPSKTLLRHSEVIELMEKAKNWGIEFGSVSISFEKMISRKTTVVENLRNGVASLLRNARVDVYNGTAIVESNHQINIELKYGSETITADKIIIATGSKPFVPSINGIENVGYHTSDSIFELASLPQSLVIVGGGIIGVEFACIFSALNVEVTIIEMADRLISAEDGEAADLISKKLAKDKVNILTSAKVQELSQNENGKMVRLETKNGEHISIQADELLLASGRTPNLSVISKLNLKKNGPFIAVNKQMETSIPHIYAVGDVIGGWQLAHVASAEGIVAAWNACNLFKEINYKVVPRCIYSSPEIASVGLTEKEAKEKGKSVRTEMFHFRASGKAMAMDESTGFIKLIADETYNEILGVTMVGPHVTEMISEASTLILLEGTVNELEAIIHPHPTLSEGIGEAARAWLHKKKVHAMS